MFEIHLEKCVLLHLLLVSVVVVEVVVEEGVGEEGARSLLLFVSRQNGSTSRVKFFFFYVQSHLLSRQVCFFFLFLYVQRGSKKWAAQMRHLSHHVSA